MPASALPRVRKLCLALPDTTEVKSWGEPTFRVLGRIFAMYAGPGNHHGAGREALWLNCTQINQELMIADDPKRFFKPAYVGPYGWIGVYIDKRPNWKLVAECVKDAYDMTAAKVKRKKRSLLDPDSDPKPARSNTKPGRAKARRRV